MFGFFRHKQLHTRQTNLWSGGKRSWDQIQKHTNTIQRQHCLPDCKRMIQHCFCVRWQLKSFESLSAAVISELSEVRNKGRVENKRKKASNTDTLRDICVPTMNSQDSGWLQTLPDCRSLFFSPVYNVQLGLVWNWFRKLWPWGQFTLLDHPLKSGQLGQLWPTLLKHGANVKIDTRNILAMNWRRKYSTLLRVVAGCAWKITDKRKNSSNVALLCVDSSAAAADVCISVSWWVGEEAETWIDGGSCVGQPD